jgi:putative hydrolase of the HAD superfamily
MAHVSPSAKSPRYRAVAFDLDGTLYPNWRFYIRLGPFVLKEQRYLRAFGKARDRLRAEGAAFPGDPAAFYRRQALYMAEILGLGRDDASLEAIAAKTEKIMYRGWEPHFKKVKLFPHVGECLAALRGAGVKLGLLSDFPPETKLEHLGLAGLWDAVLCSEVSGAIKPGILPFEDLARALGAAPAETLYVGNSFRYDVVGAKNAGMETAWKVPRFHRGSADKKVPADFSFYDYRQLRDYVL